MSSNYTAISSKSLESSHDSTGSSTPQSFLQAKNESITPTTTNYNANSLDTLSDSEQPTKIFIISTKYLLQCAIIAMVQANTDQGLDEPYFIIELKYSDLTTKYILRKPEHFRLLYNCLIRQSKISAKIISIPLKPKFDSALFGVIEKYKSELTQFLRVALTNPLIKNRSVVQAFISYDFKQPSSPKMTPCSTPSSNPSTTIPNKGGQVNASVKPSQTITEIFQESKSEIDCRMAIDRSFSQLKGQILALNESLEKLERIKSMFYLLNNPINFILYKPYVHLVIQLGYYLSCIISPPNYIQAPLPILQPAKSWKLTKLRDYMLMQVAEVQAKLELIKSEMLSILDPNEQAMLMTHCTDIQDIFNSSNPMANLLGFRIESGFVPHQLNVSLLPDFISSNIYSYKTHFYGKEHLVAYNGERVEGPIVIAVRSEHLERHYGRFRVIICSKDGNESQLVEVRLLNLMIHWRELFTDIVTAMDPRLRGIEWSTCPTSDIEPLLLEFEKKDLRITRRLKFGVLLVLKGQTREEQMFENLSIPSFDYFIEGLGKRIQLSGYQGFSGGLDTRGTNSTGTHAIASTWTIPFHPVSIPTDIINMISSSATNIDAPSGHIGVRPKYFSIENNNGEEEVDPKTFEIIYHVSTMLPFGEQDQNLAKKRHIGNDIVVVIFQEEGCEPFLPTTIKSNYIQILIVVQAIELGSNRWAWRVTSCSAQDVPPFGPPLPFPPIFLDRDVLCQWLLCKMVNGELAAYHSKLFIQQFRTTCKTLLSEVIAKLPASKKKKRK